MEVISKAKQVKMIGDSRMGSESEMKRNRKYRNIIFVYASSGFYRIDIGGVDGDNNEGKKKDAKSGLWRYPCTLDDNYLPFSAVGVDSPDLDSGSGSGSGSGSDSSSVHTIYAIGVCFDDNDDYKCRIRLRTVNGVSRLLLEGKGSESDKLWEWERGPDMVSGTKVGPITAFLDGKIYAFKGITKGSFGEVLDTQTGQWFELIRPHFPDHYSLVVSSAIVRDVAKHRLLMLFHANSSYKDRNYAVFAYYPQQDVWERVSREEDSIKFYHLWGNPAAVAQEVVDDIIYFHDPNYYDYNHFNPSSSGIGHGLIAAYDLSQGQWLKVEGWSSFSPALACQEYQFLLHLGSDFLCLAAGLQGNKQTAMLFVKFRVQRASQGHACVTYVSRQYHYTDICIVENMIPVTAT